MPESPDGVRLRGLRSGDLGWIIGRNGELYADECGWDLTYEAHVASVVGAYAVNRDPAWENAWIAERGGERLGAVFCVRPDERVAQLRVLHVEPSARGAGVGAALVNTCLEFARAVGYAEIMLWTTAVQHAAIRLYERAGFRLDVEEPPADRFGDTIHGQIWRRPL